MHVVHYAHLNMTLGVYLAGTVFMSSGYTQVAQALDALHQFSLGDLHFLFIKYQFSILKSGRK